MADEIAQVCQMEIEGTTMVIKGSVKVISWLAQAIKALLQNAAERKTEHGGEKHDMRVSLPVKRPYAITLIEAGYQSA